MRRASLKARERERLKAKQELVYVETCVSLHSFMVEKGKVKRKKKRIREQR